MNNSDLKNIKNPKCTIFGKLVEDYNKDRIRQKDYNVAGMVHPLRPNFAAKGYVPVGTTVFDAIKKACEEANVRPSFMKRGVAQIGVRDVEKGVTIWRPCPQNRWKTRKIKEGELLRFRLLPQGGGGGKNPFRTLLTVIVAVAAIAVASITQQWALGVAALTKVTATGIALNAAGTALVGISGLAVSTIGMVLVNAIAPVKPVSLGMSNTRQESQVYSISAGRNAVNPWGRVPVPLGVGRFAPPKAASPYTVNSGEDQYLHELLCPGIGDLEISEIKIGTNPIEEFTDVQYEIFKYDPNLKNAPKLYPTGVFQEDLSIQLKHDVWNTRTTAECDSAECDISFQGLTYFKDNGDRDNTSVSFYVQYKKEDVESWSSVPLPKNITGKSIEISEIPNDEADGVVAISKNGDISVFWNGNNVPNGYYLIRKIHGKRITIIDNDPDASGDFEKVDGWLNTTEELFPGSGIFVPVMRLQWLAVELSFRGSENDKDPRVHLLGITINLTQAYYDRYMVQEADSSESFRDVPVTTKKHSKIQISSGTFSYSDVDAGAMPITYTDAKSTLVRKSLRIDFPSRGVYQVRWKRITEDSTDDRRRDDSFWTALKSISTDKPVNTTYPVTLLAIRAKATGQLSGTLDNVTIFYRSRINDWDSTSKTWVKRFTSNPASIFRHVLQDKDAMARPQPDSIIDLATLQEAHEYWNRLGWKYNFVCDASTSVFERLQSICAAGLASPTMVDGKWSLIIDKPRSHVVCAFTSANAWSWSFKRNQVRLPNEIHCTFISETTWDTMERRVATDEPVRGDFLYENQSYEGVNNPAQVFHLARFHYADAKVRRRTISFRCYDEALLCTRGDLVECACPNVSPQGLQVGRIRKVVRNEDGDVIELITDQTQSTDFSGRRFGVRIYAQDGTVFHAEILPEDKTQNKLTLFSPQKMEVESGDKYAFGDYSEEVFQAIVLSMNFNSDWTCDVILQDYTPQIYGDLSKPIPPFSSIITKPIEEKWKITSIPIINSILTDESVLIKNGSVSTPRMLVTISHPGALDPRAKYMSVDYSLAGENKWINAVRNCPLDETDVYIEGVVEKSLYDIRVNYISDLGDTGPYAYAKNVYVIGRTTPPNPPDAVLLDGYNLIIQHKNRTLDVVGYVVYMTFDEDDPFEWASQISSPYTTSMTFDLTNWAGRARRVWVRTIDELGLMSDPVSVVVNLGDVIPKNVLIQISEKEKDWSGNIVNGTIIDDDLVSLESGYLFPQGTEDFLFQQNNEFSLFPSSSALMMQYSWREYFIEDYAGASVKVMNEFESGKLLKLEYRVWKKPYLFKQGTNEYLFEQSSSGYLFPQLIETEWKAFPTNYITPGSETLEFRITYSDSEVARLNDILTIIDVPDKDWTVSDLTITPEGVFIPIPKDTFRKIVNISFGLQYVETDAINVYYVPNTEVEGDNGFLEKGPLVYVLNKQGDKTSGSVDIRMKGF